uniref:Mab-21 domain-containing protein n=1 Tax=Steinernema glaseri TaxID=37863 RepID=A0A1I8A0S8_9BILA
MEFKLGGSEEDLSEVSLEPLKPVVPPCSHQRNVEEDGEVTYAEKTVLFFQKELCWLQANQSEQTFRTMEGYLKDCCRKLYVGNKMDPRAHVVHAPPQTEKFALAQRTGQDQLRANVFLLAENVIETDVTLKHPKCPGGVYRATARPNVQWKLQQVQDAGNLCLRTLGLIMQGYSRSIDLSTKGSWCEQSAEFFIQICTQIAEAIGSARNTLCVPRKRTLLEICHFQPTKCFNPPLPSDILFSYYLSSARLVCAAYNVAQRSNGGGHLSITQADCHLPHIADVLQKLDIAYKVNASFLQNLKAILKSKNSVYIERTASC